MKKVEGFSPQPIIDVVDTSCSGSPIECAVKNFNENNKIQNDVAKGDASPPIEDIKETTNNIKEETQIKLSRLQKLKEENYSEITKNLETLKSKINQLESESESESDTESDEEDEDDDDDTETWFQDEMDFLIEEEEELEEEDIEMEESF